MAQENGRLPPSQIDSAMPGSGMDLEGGEDIEVETVEEETPGFDESMVEIQEDGSANINFEEAAAEELSKDFDFKQMQIAALEDDRRSPWCVKLDIPANIQPQNISFIPQQIIKSIRIGGFYLADSSPPTTENNTEYTYTYTKSDIKFHVLARPEQFLPIYTEKGINEKSKYWNNVSCNRRYARLHRKLVRN